MLNFVRFGFLVDHNNDTQYSILIFVNTITIAIQDYQPHINFPIVIIITKQVIIFIALIIVIVIVVAIVIIHYS